MTVLSKTFGIAARNFTAYPEMPSAKALVDYGVRVEELGFDSVWVWDHMLLGVDPNFPIIDSLTVLTGIAARTKRIKMGTGILVLPLRNPVALAKQLSSMDQLSDGRLVMGMASGWYKREFDAMGTPFEKRGKIMDENLEIMRRLWTEPSVSGEYMNHKISKAVMYPKPHQSEIPILIGGYVDRVLQRAGTVGDGWLTYFYRAEDFKRSWDKIRTYAKEGGKDPDKLLNASQLPIMIGPSKDAVREAMMDWLNKEWDFPEHSDCTRESAVMGSVDDCVAQLKEHIDAGVQKIIFVPYKYQMEQVETIAREIIPRLKAL
ncbi:MULTISPECIES: LLM class flavin-dependent oxidoreductase [unclassified Mesorhizobium]|uniref:LLM class flavin-dependent oxidoreductase n=1 Tax=unclassified Mesorhizobium TaxID=325217 RepID=UPI001128435F|nr:MULTISPECIES: TIGR03619 family F420-dependent LLM class oxidoreductase [unclassified Mesorhizobium]MBZ9810986.1 TIGR03619 family F420-dependent LLM class oxidoreductase [Mesorhizobium sp. ESP-6-2]TPM27766.1 TIGR03619 family F420-dependent LLM class oxidoreductase [Mesorhizobium sp. B2-2-2]